MLNLRNSSLDGMGNATARHAALRRGAVLIIVLWAVAILSIILMNFAFMAKTHLRLAGNYADANLLHNIAFAGIERATIELKRDSDGEKATDHLGEAWADSAADFYQSPVGTGHFTLQRSQAAQGKEPTYGMEDEASKLNLHTATREMLLTLEGMDEALADALLDWQDDDSQTREQGAESEYYESLDQPYSCKNGKLTTLYELLLVKGFTGEIVFGEDANGNGLLDANENDGATSVPNDDQDGVLDVGILPFVTVYSSDKNVSANGKKRVDLNSATESQLKEAISDLKDNEAKAIVAHRGRNQFKNLGELLNVRAADDPQQQAQQQQQPSRDASDRGGRDRNGPSPGGPSRSSSEPSPSAGSDSPRGNERSASGSSSNRNGDPTASGAKVLSTQRFKEIVDYCAIGGESSAAGRINISTAPEEVLRALPGMTESLARSIVENRAERADGFESIADLLDISGMSESIFINLSNYVTVRSYQFRAQSVAQIEGVRARRTAIAVLDRSAEKIATIYWNEQ